MSRGVWYLAWGAAFGLVMTIAVSWSLAAFWPQRGWRIDRFHEAFLPQRHPFYAIFKFSSFGCVRRGWERMDAGELRSLEFLRAIDGADGNGQLLDYSADPAWRTWGRLDAIVRDHPSEEWGGCEHATGWPLPALWYDVRRVWTPSLPITIRGGITLPASRNLAGRSLAVSDVRALPYQPVWAGLVIDATLFGVLGAILFRGVTLVRRSYRLRRGLCPACGYSLSGLPPGGACPECGKATFAEQQMADR